MALYFMVSRPASRPDPRQIEMCTSTNAIISGGGSVPVLNIHVVYDLYTVESTIPRRPERAFFSVVMAYSRTVRRSGSPNAQSHSQSQNSCLRYHHKYDIVIRNRTATGSSVEPFDLPASNDWYTVCTAGRLHTAAAPRHALRTVAIAGPRARGPVAIAAPVKMP